MSSSNDSSDSTVDFNLACAHGTVMVFAWMFFAPTGILIARYGRFLHIGTRRKLLGDSIWFQAHRLALALAAIATLLGFFLILAETQSTWVDLDSDGPLLYAHSIMGVTIVGLATIQIWMALFRCHPSSKFRFIYNWVHRTTGLLAFVLSVPTIFVIVNWLPLNHDGLVTILSLWTAWVVIVVLAFEFLQHQSKIRRNSSNNHRGTKQTAHELPRIDHEPNEVTVVEEEDVESDTMNKAKLILLSIHAVVAIALVIPLLVLIWGQN
jgi:hypothetical protein